MTINLNLIQQKMIEGYKYARLAKGKDLIFLLGRTGAGKSTTGNYLLGKKLTKGLDEHGRDAIVIDGSSSFFEIGQTHRSCTLYAATHGHIFYDNNYLTDCPGFEGNRGTEYDIVESMSTELAVRGASQIKSFLIVVPYFDFKDSKIDHLYKLVKTLARLFNNLQEMLKYSIFLITQIPEDQENIILRNIEGGINAAISKCKHEISSLKTDVDSEYKINPEGLNVTDYELIEQYLGLLQQNLTEKLVLINPLDQGKSRTEVIKKISLITNQTGNFNIIDEHFNFSKYNKNRKLFDKSILELACVLDDLKQKYADYDEKIQEEVSDIKYNKTKITSLEEYISKERETIDNGSNQAEIDLNEDLIEKGTEKINIKKRKLEEIASRKKNLSQELSEIDTNTEKLYYKKEINETTSWWSLFSWRELKVDVKTLNNQEIINVKKSMQNGRWAQEYDNKKNGEYSIKYQSKYKPQPAQACIEVFIRTKDDPENKKKIDIYKQELKKLAEEEVAINQDIAYIIASNQECQSNIEQAKFMQTKIKTKETKVLEAEKSITKFKSKIQEIEEKNIASKKELENVKKNIVSKANEIKFLIYIAKCGLYSSDNLVNEVSEKYKKFFENKKDEFEDIASFIRSLEQQDHFLSKETEQSDALTKQQKVLENIVHLKHLKCLMFDNSILLGDIVSVPNSNDLILKEMDRAHFEVLKDGIAIIEKLNILVNRYSYTITLHSEHKKEEQLIWIKKLKDACVRREILFPTILGIADLDEETYKGVEPKEPRIIRDNDNDILIAGYGYQLDGKTSVRLALSALFNITEDTRMQHVVLDDGSLIIKQAIKEGWQTYHIGKEISLLEAINTVCENANRREVFFAFRDAPRDGNLRSQGLPTAQQAQEEKIDFLKKQQQISENAADLNIPFEISESSTVRLKPRE